MKIRNTMLIASLLLLPAITSLAGAPITIPMEIAKNMKRGKQLDQVWAAPGFDGTKGFRLGAITNDSDNEAQALMEYIPVALKGLMKNDSPYTLNFAVISARFKSNSSGYASERIETEGRLVDKTGAIVAAFTAHAVDTTGGSENSNSRSAMRAIAFAMTKDLFASALPSEAKSPAVMVPAPAAPPVSLKAPIIFMPAPLPPAPAAPSLSAPNAEKAPEAPAASIGTPATPAALPPAASQPKPIPVAPQPEVVTPLISPSSAANMKRGAGLWKVWISPSYVKTRGFSLGEVRYRVEARNDGIDKYLPEALAEIAKQDAPCVLELQIVELAVRVLTRGVSSVQLGVEGRLVAKDGTLMATFETRTGVKGNGDSVDDCRSAARAVVAAISKDLL